MMIAQALGEYGVMSSLMEGLRSAGFYLEDLGREWGLAGAGIAVAVAVAWKILTRVK